jgi:allophanate hydrolase subunit 1
MNGSLPSKPTLESKFPKAGVGIAGKQTGIYPLGPRRMADNRTNEMKMFDASSEQPCPLEPGDE